MSIETWKAEFYPVPASEVPAEDALQHSLRKWIGLREENLSKHACTVYHYVELTDGRKEIDIDSSSCALCECYCALNDDYEYECSSCPIVKLTGKSCDNGRKSPWGKWTTGRGPESMIAVLKECIAEQEKEKS